MKYLKPLMLIEAILSLPILSLSTLANSDSISNEFPTKNTQKLVSVQIKKTAARTILGGGRARTTSSTNGFRSSLFQAHYSLLTFFFSIEHLIRYFMYCPYYLQT
ncbi:hypothetical protein ABFS82_11G031900 [Erythranthe guttata]